MYTAPPCVNGRHSSDIAVAFLVRTTVHGRTDRQTALYDVVHSVEVFALKRTNTDIQHQTVVSVELVHKALDDHAHVVQLGCQVLVRNARRHLELS